MRHHIRFQTVVSRSTMIDLLGYLTAEWSVRLLFEEVMIDREGQEVAGFDQPITEDLLEEMALNNKLWKFRRNDTMAAREILDMKLVGVPKVRWPYRNTTSGPTLERLVSQE